jgi:hypothetical protein
MGKVSRQIALLSWVKNPDTSAGRVFFGRHEDRQQSRRSVCGQRSGAKGVIWTLDFNRFVDHIMHRENKNLGGRRTRFERGTLKDLYRNRLASRKALPEYSMIVVQPGVSKISFKPELSSILGATSLFLRQRLNTKLKAWVSP